MAPAFNNLRLIEQQARRIREVAPCLYDLAVSANSRLREMLALAQLGHDSSSSVDNLEAPVLTWHVRSAQRLTSTSVSTRYPPQIVILRG